MRDRHVPRFGLALLERFVPDSEPLAGDLVEEFESAHPQCGSGCRCWPLLPPHGAHEAVKFGRCVWWIVSLPTRWNAAVA